MVPIRAANWKRLIRYLFMNVLSRVSIIIKRHRCSVTEITGQFSISMKTIYSQADQFSVSLLSKIYRNSSFHSNLNLSSLSFVLLNFKDFFQ